MSFNTLGLAAKIVRAVSEKGYSNTTPIQSQAIPVILEGRDVMAGAQTGTGKTAAFTLPLLHRLSNQPQSNNKRFIRALILTPTRELAVQVSESVRSYGKYLNLKSTVIYGGVNIFNQRQQLQRGVDIIIATPGRLLDHVRQNTIDLSKVEILVLDEADRMLDMGFIPDVRKIVTLMPKQKQCLLFFATFSNELKRLAHGLLTSPVLIEVAPRNTVAKSVVQVVHPVNKARKRELLSFLIGSNNWKQVLVFTRTKYGAARLAQQLKKDGLSATEIHGDKRQGARTRALEKFKQGHVRVLVATDLASRGLDIDQLPHVVNFELPQTPEDYVHRIGRTGRAGKNGEAISLVCGEEGKLLKGIEKILKITIPKVVIPGYDSGPLLNSNGDNKPKNLRGKKRFDSRSKKNKYQSKKARSSQYGGNKQQRISNRRHKSRGK